MNTNNRVQVLMSTFNGETYLSEQLDSIISQKNISVNLLIRDDGSTDNTCAIIAEYQSKYDNIELLKGENVGFKESFKLLLKASGDFDYYAFADQDDVWMDMKLEVAVSKLQSPDSHISKMYYSNLTIVDSRLNYLSLLHAAKRILPLNQTMALVLGFAHGCTMVFNKTLRNQILNYDYPANYPHDFWIPLIGFLLGKVTYDNDSYILYRQHSENIYGGVRRKVWVQYKIVTENGNDFYNGLANNLLKGYSTFLSTELVTVLNDIITYKKNIFAKLRLLMNHNLRRSTLKGTLYLRYMILVSKF